MIRPVNVVDSLSETFNESSIAWRRGLRGVYIVENVSCLVLAYSPSIHGNQTFVNSVSTLVRRKPDAGSLNLKSKIALLSCRCPFSAQCPLYLQPISPPAICQTLSNSTVLFFHLAFKTLRSSRINPVFGSETESASCPTWDVLYSASSFRCHSTVSSNLCFFPSLDKCFITDQFRTS